MIFEASDFIFKVPPVVSRARRVLIKPSASYPVPYPVTTSPEMLAAIGSDPEHPEDLGAEFELFMGEEMEKHIITKSTLIYIPENTVHCPFIINKVTRPFLFMQAHYGPKLAETARRDLVPEDMRTKYIFIDMDGSSEKK